jgi:peptidoglycan/xylan/chitin deacetylase (PgdA/CDA1 family)
LFARYRIHATWATVGFLLFDKKKELLDYLPSLRPRYTRGEFDPYEDLPQIGENEQADPLHFALSLVRQILDCEGMELGTHTFSHYYCLEDGQDVEAFRADLAAAAAATRRLTTMPVSLVFPRNQYNHAYLKACADSGIRVIRTSEKSRPYRPTNRSSDSPVWRGARLLDAYFNVCGSGTFIPSLEEGVHCLPSSRFLRPVTSRLRRFDSLRYSRIADAMTSAAKNNTSYHLWWHPHNFGANMDENLAFLEEILRHYATLRDVYGFRSLTMSEMALGGGLMA